MTGARKPGGNFTQPAVSLLTHEVRYHVYLGWHRQPREYESAAEAEQALHELLERRETPVPDPDNWLADDQLELWLK